MDPRSTSLPIDVPGDLLGDVSRLRALAAHLVSDPTTAEDVLQDAWVAALTRRYPPRDFRTWIAGTVRHLALRFHRSSERRMRREVAGARDESLPSSVDLVAKSELVERLMALVRGLDEPHRTTVMLHYLEGWTLERIARRERNPSSTVRKAWRARSSSCASGWIAKRAAIARSGSPPSCLSRVTGLPSQPRVPPPAYRSLRSP